MPREASIRKVCSQSNTHNQFWIEFPDTQPWLPSLLIEEHIHSCETEKKRNQFAKIWRCKYVKKTHHLWDSPLDFSVTLMVTS